MSNGGLSLALIGRAVLSLAIVLGLILVTYVVIKRRRASGGRAFAAAPRRAATSGRPVRPQLSVLSRVATSRSSSVSAIQFGDRVLLVGTTEQAATQVLAEMTMEEWDPAVPMDPETELLTAGRTPVGNFVEALRTATARHA